jgi:hypothetical protein
MGENDSRVGAASHLPPEGSMKRAVGTPRCEKRSQGICIIRAEHVFGFRTMV